MLGKPQKEPRMSQKVERPTLQGQRFRTRKRDEKEKFNPSGFRDSILQSFNELNDGKLDGCDGLIKCLLTNGTFDFRVYGEVLFDIIIAGGILAPGGSIVIDSDNTKPSKTDICLFKAVDQDDLVAIKSFANIFVRLIQRFGYLEKTLVEEFKRITDSLRNFDHVATSNEDQLKSLQSDLSLFIGATFLQLFVIDNFLGPVQNHNWTQSIVLEVFKSNFDVRQLKIDSVDVCHVINNPWLLYLAGKFLDQHYSVVGACKQGLLWRARFYSVYVSVLLDPVESILEKLKLLHEQIYPLVNVGEHIDILCELSQSALMRDDLVFSRKALDTALRVSGFEIEATGVLGKRTKFQEKLVPQLIINVCGNQDQIQATEHTANLPAEVPLNSDELLPDIELENPKKPTSIPEDAQLLLLASLSLSTKSESMDEAIAIEFSSAYLRTLIETSTLWCVKYKSLMLRCQIEAKTSRKSERALLQMEILTRLSSGRSSNETIPLERLSHFYSVMPLPVWSVQSLYGDLCIHLGLHKTALDVFLKVNNWDKVIQCYKILEMNDKAEEIIRQELAKEETPHLYCLLGDIHEKPDYYNKAWELSKFRYARAQQCLGTYYYVRKEYEKASEHYGLALKINPNNVDVLSMLSYTYLSLEAYEKAAHYYRMLSQLDEKNFLVWNNLSKAYIKLGQKERAHLTLNQAIKCNYDEWKLWENFLFVSMDIGAFADVIKSWHRLLDLKQRYNDEYLLERLTDAILIDGSSSGHLIQPALDLLDRIRLTSSTSSKTLMCYAKIKNSSAG